jgi:glycosyltransferase involved in cell wall biosynthesis
MAWALWRLHSKYRFHVVEFPHWEGIAFVSTALRIAPIVVRLHTSTIQSVEVEDRPPSAGERFMIWAEKVSARRARLVITHTHAHRETLEAAYGIRAARVIPHGIEAPGAAPPARSLSVLSIGMNARKGIDTMLAAAASVLRRVPEAEFWLVGADPDGRREREFREKNPDVPRDRVRFLGTVSDDDLIRMYADCSVYASASRYESFGLTFAEAMAHAKPVIGFATSGIRDVVADGETGFLVPPDDLPAFVDALVSLLEDGDLRKRLGAAGRRRVIERFSVDRMADELESVFAEVAGVA